jgi:hypothetical protein
MGMIWGLNTGDFFIVITVAVGIGYLMYQFFINPNDVGKIFTKKAKSTRVLITELVLGFINLVEAMIAKHITSAVETSISFPGAWRLFLHLSISALSALASLNLFDQLRQAFQAFRPLFDAASYGQRVTPGFIISKIWDLIREWAEFFITFALAVGGPLINLGFVAYACGDFFKILSGNFYGLALPTVSSLLITIFHFIGIAYLAIITAEEITAELKKPTANFNAPVEDVFKFFIKHGHLGSITKDELLNKLRGNADAFRIEQGLRNAYHDAVINNKILRSGNEYTLEEREKAIKGFEEKIDEGRQIILNKLN